MRFFAVLWLSLCASLAFAAPPTAARFAPVHLDPADCVFLNAYPTASGSAVTDGATANTMGGALDIGKIGRLSMGVSWTPVTTPSGSAVKLQTATTTGVPASTDWVDKSGASVTLTAATAAGVVIVTGLSEKWARAVITVNSPASTGAVTASCNASTL
jgi:hypothetical protein